MANTKREELLKQIEELKNRQFMNQMDDHWTGAQYALDRKLSMEIKALQEEISKLDAEDDLK